MRNELKDQLNTIWRWKQIELEKKRMSESNIGDGLSEACKHRRDSVERE